MSLVVFFFAGIGFGGLLVWFLRPENTGATTVPVLSFSRPQEINSTRLVRVMKDEK